MRKITQQSVAAFMAAGRLSSGNMTVTTSPDPDTGNPITDMLLHGNLIARGGVMAGQRRIVITDAGWQTVTTKERLNGLLSAFAPGYGLFQKDFAWYLDTPNGTVDWNGRAVFTCEGVLISTR